MDDKNIVLWGLLLSIVVVCTYWHIHENRQLSRQWKETFGNDASEWLIRFAWSRTTQLLLTLVCCVLVIIVYDWQLGETRHALHAFSKIDANTHRQSSTLQRKPLPEQPSEPAGATETATPSSPAEPVILVPSFDTAVPATSSVEEVYNPASSGDQSAMDSMKKRYEDILVNYFFLRKCGKVNPNDYHVITSALSQEMASINAPGRLQNDILTAAQGSYNEMYAQSSCADADALHTKYSEFISALSKNFTVQ